MQGVRNVPRCRSLCTTEENNVVTKLRYVRDLYHVVKLYMNVGNSMVVKLVVKNTQTLVG